MNSEDVAWLAGLLEGEGYFSASTHAGRRPRLRISLKMCDRDVVIRAADVMGTGNKISPRPHSNPRSTLAYELNVYSAEAERIMCAILPFMGLRRATKITELLGMDLSHR